MFSKMEQQISKQEVSLKGMNERERSWFQTMKQRKTEKDRLENNFKATEEARKQENSKGTDVNGKRKADLSKLSDSKRKKKEDMERKKDTSNKHPSQIAKQRYIQSKERASLIRAKANKSLHKTKRLRQLDEDFGSQKLTKTKRESKFSIDLTATGRRAKQLR